MAGQRFHNRVHCLFETQVQASESFLVKENQKYTQPTFIDFLIINILSLRQKKLKVVSTNVKSNAVVPVSFIEDKDLKIVHVEGGIFIQVLQDSKPKERPSNMYLLIENLSQSIFMFIVKYMHVYSMYNLHLCIIVCDAFTHLPGVQTTTLQPCNRAHSNFRSFPPMTRPALNV